MSEISNLSKNFGKIKHYYNNALSDGLITKNKTSKSKFKEYLLSIKENSILRLQFLVYTNIENKVESDRNKAIQFVKENIDLFSNVNKKDIIENNNKLLKSIIIEGEIEENKKLLYENISKLIFLKRNPTSIDEMISSTNSIVDYILSNQPKVIGESIELPNSMLSVMMVDKYNEKYSTLDEDERKILKVLIDSTDEEKQNLYKSIVRECIDEIDVKLETNDLDIKDKLLKVKDKLLNDKNDLNEDYLNKIVKVNTLKNNLK